jgi:hypothetical protein
MRTQDLVEEKAATAKDDALWSEAEAMVVTRVPISSKRPDANGVKLRASGKTEEVRAGASCHEAQWKAAAEEQSGSLGLELFARELHAGWTSWGNEVLRFQERET